MDLFDKFDKDPFPWMWLSLVFTAVPIIVLTGVGLDFSTAVLVVVAVDLSGAVGILMWLHWKMKEDVLGKLDSLRIKHDDIYRSLSYQRDILKRIELQGQVIEEYE